MKLKTEWASVVLDVSRSDDGTTVTVQYAQNTRGQWFWRARGIKANSYWGGGFGRWSLFPHPPAFLPGTLSATRARVIADYPFNDGYFN